MVVEPLFLRHASPLLCDPISVSVSRSAPPFVSVGKTTGSRAAEKSSDVWSVGQDLFRANFKWLSSQSGTTMFSVGQAQQSLAVG
jgi:hypothetical protein